MKINQFRSILYKVAKYSGDVQAVKNGRIGKRIVRRIVGKYASRLLWGKLFK